MYKATKTIKVASKGLDSRPYYLEEGKPLSREMDSATLCHCLKKGFIEKTSNGLGESPENKQGDLGSEQKAKPKKRRSRKSKAQKEQDELEKSAEEAGENTEEQD